MFTNKLFRGFGLNNNQKLRVVEQVRQNSKLERNKISSFTLAESFKGNGNKKVNESKGQALKMLNQLNLRKKFFLKVKK